MGATAPYTFVCLALNQEACHVDIQDLSEGAQRQHALRLLRDHASAATVEVWRGDAVLELIARDGVRAASDVEVGALPPPWGAGHEAAGAEH